MIKWFLDHNWKSIKRSPDFQRKVIINIIIGLFMMIIMLDLLLLGIFFVRMIREDLMPGSDPLVVFNGGLMYYFGAEFILRLNFQKLKLANAKNYLLLKVGRDRIVKYLLGKTIFTFINFFPLLVLIPFFINGVIVSNDPLSSFSWLISILSLMLFNTYLANYSKLRFFKNPVKTSILAGALIFLVFLEKINVISMTSLSAFLFSSILQYPLLAIIPVISVYAAFTLNRKFLLNILYIENIFNEKKQKKIRENFKFLSAFGRAGHLIALDLKMLIRNKRTKAILWMSFFFILYGLFFYPTQDYTRNNFFTDFFLMFIGSFISGFFIFSYGVSTFAYESRHFGIILTNKIEMRNYLEAKYYFMLLMTVIPYLLSVFYIYFGVKVFFVNSMMFLFNCGVTSFFFLYLATFNKVSFDLNAGQYSMQGKGSIQFFGVFIFVLLLLVLFLPAALIINRFAGHIFIGSLGFLGLIFHKQILGILLKQLYKRKYIMSEGFRQTKF